MLNNQWKPNTTVAAIIENDGRFLMVRELTESGIRINQPAGHLEYGESLLDAVIREAYEETAHDFTPQALVGIYMADKDDSDITYLRFAYCGHATPQPDPAPLDDGILEAVWMTHAEIVAAEDIWRSPLVGRCIEDYLAGQRAPLSLVYHHQAG